MKSFSQFKTEQLRDKTIAREYAKLESQFQLIDQLIEARRKRGLTQKDLADKIGTKQSAISRLESGNANPSLLLLEKISKALDTRLIVTIG